MKRGDNRLVLDLVGVPCPLSWARAKARLEGLRPGMVLELVTSDERALRDIPAAAEAEGYLVVEVRSAALEGEPARILIER